MLSANNAHLFYSRLWVPCILLLINSSPKVLVYKDCDKWLPNRDLVNALGKRMERLLAPEEVGKCGIIDKRLKSPPLFYFPFTIYLRFKDLSVLCQWIEAFLETVVKYKSWFPDEGSLELEIWRWVKKM